MFVQLKKETLIEKIVERDAFLMKPKHEYHLSEWEERVYMPNHEKKGLLCESVFVQIDERTLVLKVVERKVFLLKPKLQYNLS